MSSIVHVTTVPDSLGFIDGLVGFLLRQGDTVDIVSSPGERLSAFGRKWNIPVHAIEMPRRVSPLEDLDALWRLTSRIERIRPDVVHAHTPKGGLLGMLAARAAHVPVRIYQMRGLPLMTATGTLRALLTMTERIACAQATQVFCQSPSLRTIALQERLCPASKIEVILQGSNGVDGDVRFNPALHASKRGPTRLRWGVPMDALVVAFVGRMVKDKGIVELAEAWGTVRERNPTAHLVLAGPYEPRDPVPHKTVNALESDPRVHVLGYVEDTPAVYSASDLVVLPTWREGFPNVPLEAAAMGLPVVATRIPGCVDAVVDGETGSLTPARDSLALAETLGKYLGDTALRLEQGAAGRRRVLKDFGHQKIWAATAARYQTELTKIRIAT